MDKQSQNPKSSEIAWEKLKLDKNLRPRMFEIESRIKTGDTDLARKLWLGLCKEYPNVSADIFNVWEVNQSNASSDLKESDVDNKPKEKKHNTHNNLAHLGAEDSVFLRAIENLKREKKYNAIPFSENEEIKNQVNTAIDRAASREISNGRTSSDYSLAEETAFEDWCIKHNIAPQDARAQEFRRTGTFRDEADKFFLSQNQEQRSKFLEQERAKTYQNPANDPVIKELDKILLERAKNRGLKETDVSQDANTQRSSEMMFEELRRRFPEKYGDYEKIVDARAEQGNKSVNRYREVFSNSQNEGESSWENTGQSQTNVFDRINSLQQRGRNFLRTGERGTGRAAARSGSRAVSKAGSKALQGLGKSGAQLLARAATSNPWVLLVIVIIVVIILLIILIAGGLSSLDSEDSIQVTKSANKQEVPNPIAGTANSNITYTLAVSASNSQSITLVDPIPSNAEFVSATGNYILNKDSGGIVTAVKWILSLSGGGQSGSSNTSPSTTLCGNKSTPPTGTAPNFSCTGKWGTTPVVDGYYIPTWFGCSTKYGKDPSDNCLPGCTSIPECSGISGPDCERNLKWFAADAGRYGCNSKLKVTNPQTGSAVVVKVIDYGPSCSVEKGRGKMDVSRDAQEAIGNSSLVHVEKVSDATALGPIPACTNQTQAVPQQSTQSLTFDTARFKQYGFPNPTSPTVMSDAAKNRWQKYMMPHAVKVASLLNIDIGWIGMWAWIEDSFNTYMDNCRDSEYNPNTYCSGWGGQWQVGYGNHPAYMLGYLKSAISAMHPGKTVQQIGQGVIDNSNVQDKYSGKFRPITTPATFPNKTADEILSGANRGSSESRMLLGILMKDDAIGTYLIGQHFKDLTSQHRGKLASVMNRWTSGGYYAPQKIINYIAGIYNVGISTNPASGGLATSSSVELTIRPKLSTVDTYIVNQAYTEGLGGITNTSNSTSASSLKNVPPSSNTCSIYKLSSYGNFGDPNCDFSKSQKALYVNNKYSLAKSSQRQWYSPSPLTDQLKRVDPLNATYWTGIAYCESSFNPNAINPNSPNPPAMGLMQMGKTADQGNAYWINQVENAVRYNNLLIKRGLPWRYWECARSVFKLW